MDGCLTGRCNLCKNYISFPFGGAARSRMILSGNGVLCWQALLALLHLAQGKFENSLFFWRTTGILEEPIEYNRKRSDVSVESKNLNTNRKNSNSIQLIIDYLCVRFSIIIYFSSWSLGIQKLFLTPILKINHSFEVIFKRSPLFWRKSLRR